MSQYYIPTSYIAFCCSSASHSLIVCVLPLPYRLRCFFQLSIAFCLFMRVEECVCVCGVSLTFTVTVSSPVLLTLSCPSIIPTSYIAICYSSAHHTHLVCVLPLAIKLKEKHLL
uniref:Uncharacterized protein n=1 Tax=Cacopsylla melanoneura TaxID=428564 RepID=A0A8D9E424_9HEMI